MPTPISTSLGLKTLKNRALEDREDRLQVFSEHFEAAILAGIEMAKKEGGEVGRASSILNKTLDEVKAG